MAHPLSIYPFPVFIEYQFWLGRKQYKLRHGCVRALKNLAQMVEDASTSDDAAWVLPFRDHIREIQRINPRVALTLVIDRTDNESLRCLAIWLRGRCGGTFENGHMGYLEGIFMYDTKAPESVMASGELVEGGAQAWVSKVDSRLPPPR